MSKDYVKTMVFGVMFVAVALVIIFFMEIRTAISGMMTGQAESLVMQLF